ncbi:TPR-like protein [Athelia psychrophila]|uniref:TPR-like protein n=1 Tax=Athelia psychrophila TaxID=1759441 RepID=A0A166PXG5_9AGAM|nr:TPR-like protein [Fibularhizoctonia sp. CBS 109695]
MPSIGPFTRPLNTCLRADLTRLANHFNIDDSGNVHALRIRLKAYLDANADILAFNMNFSALFSSRDRTRLRLDTPLSPRNPTAQSPSIHVPNGMAEPGPSAPIARPTFVSQIPTNQFRVGNALSGQPTSSLLNTIYNTSQISGGTVNNVNGDLHDNSVSHNYYGVTPAASSNPASGPPSPPLAPFNDAPVDRISSCFTGRESELEVISQFFGSLQSDQPARIVIYGMPGLGKSQLALQYAYLAFASSVYSHVFWISASTVESLSQGLARMLVLLNHTDRGHPDQAVRLAAVRLWLEQSDRYGCCRWLLILDNVTVESARFLREHLPRQNGRGTILITTRTYNIAESIANVAGQEHRTFELMALSKAHSVSLLLKKAQIQTNAPTDLASAEKLVSRIGCLPLAVEQAGSYMKRSGLKSAHQLQRMYDERGLKEVLSWQNNLTTYEEASVLATFTLQLQKLDEIDPGAHRLLKTLAFLDPENIPIDILSLGARSIRDRLTKIVEPSLSTPDPLQGVSSELRTLVELLCSEERIRGAFMHFEDLSVAQPTYGGRPALHIHDLIQWVLQQSTLIHQEGYRALAIALLCNAFQAVKDPQSPQSWDECEIFVPHFAALGIQDGTHSMISEEYLIANRSIATYFTSRGRYNEAETLLVRVLAHCRRLLGSNVIGTVNVMHKLAVVYDKLGKYKEAESLYLPVLAAQEKQFGADHVETLATVHDLAFLYWNQGKYNEAERLYARALEGREKQLRAGHPSTLTTVLGLAGLYESQGKFDKAEGFYSRALIGKEKELGADHPSTLTAVSDLADLYASQGKLDEAESLYARALAGKEKQLGADHPDTLSTVNNLALLYQSQGKWNEAEILYGRALAGEEDQLGVDHPDTLSTVNNIALLYHSQGKLDEAETLYGRALAGEEDQLGADHPKTLTTVGNLAGLYDSQGKLDEAESLYARALAGQEKQLGADHPKTLTTVGNLAGLYESRGKLDEAESLYARVLIGEEKQLGADHPSTLTTVGNLAGLYESQGKLDEAESLYARALAGQEKQLGADHPSTLITVKNLADLYETQGKLGEAESLYARALAGQEKQLGADHPSTLMTVHNLASLNKTQGKLDEAESLYARALAGQEKQLGADHPSTLITVHNFAYLRYQQGRQQEAEVLFRRALAGRKAKLGPDHPNTQRTLHHLAKVLEAQGRYQEAEVLRERMG